ncbi:DUF2267 domain-containing protein [Idiomarina sp. OT37-5b]|uniref:DUF2267 domain-containing protein n=1 Tax=Idiomarina aquatica TaxID=1327752 RepID=A0AA94EET9_9GAMM|nr:MULTISPECIES: DUF2267 domain-containing protein [Idiomarina]AVJ57300.1 DUF2267 domain-containing protein [Idiomarina sp. OT37-5b]RUO44481.1 DUF2267 domain-containing protein [Idiomarina aquatica]
MPVPPEYYHATEQFNQFMVDARDASNLETTNMAWNMVVGVFQAFRRRLTIGDALCFANFLPPGIRAVFVADWDANEKRVAFGSDEELLKEIKSVRQQHNFSPSNARSAVAIALRRNVDVQALERLLRDISDQAFEFWKVSEQELRNAETNRSLKIQLKDF